MACNEFLTFRLGGEEFGIDVLAAREIRSYDGVTTIADAPKFIIGVVNLRGTIVPIVDLRIRFNIGKAQYDRFTPVIILEVSGRIVGVVADSVSDVLALETAQIRQASEVGAANEAGHFRGIGTLDERTLTLIDAERLIADVAMGVADAPHR